MPYFLYYLYLQTQTFTCNIDQKNEEKKVDFCVFHIWLKFQLIIVAA